MFEFIIKTFRRTPLKTLLYVVLLTAASASLCIGFNLQYISQKNKQNAKNAFSAIATIETNQSFYSGDAGITNEDRIEEMNQVELEQQILDHSKAVKNTDVRFSFSAKVDQITNVINPVSFSNDAKWDGESVIVFIYQGNENIEIQEVLYGDAAYEKQHTGMQNESSVSSQFVKGTSYIAYGIFEKELWEDSVSFIIQDYSINYYPAYGLFYNEKDTSYITLGKEEQTKEFGSAQHEVH